ncbi:hypothetical protein [Salinibacter altiplanensis]|uniref:hypothetical protein n=1 Tax=Salinibacter altiplanensis TaxID=1803181 RepID=UPI000C9F09A9|nr:hypothetical protein [Salinibacter altiplanensis]
MEYLALGIILYFILRTSGNLVRLMGGEQGTSSQAGPVHESSPRQTKWEGPSPRQRTGTARDGPTFWGEDVEDARWQDLNGEAGSPDASR